MDCSKTEVFLKEVKRMCKENKYCSSCPLCAKPTCRAFRVIPIDELLDLQNIIQKWSDEHPQETILEYVEKIVPDIPKDSRGYPVFCVKSYSAKLYGSVRCISDCHGCWNRPYEEAIKESKK